MMPDPTGLYGEMMPDPTGYGEMMPDMTGSGEMLPDPTGWPAVRDFTRDGRWSTYDVSVLVRKKMGGICAEKGYPLKLPPTNLARLGHFPPDSQTGRLASPVFYVHVFSLALTSECVVQRE
jgi:hypothetical protein